MPQRVMFFSKPDIKPGDSMPFEERMMVPTFIINQPISLEAKLLYCIIYDNVHADEYYLRADAELGYTTAAFNEQKRLDEEYNNRHYYTIKEIGTKFQEYINQPPITNAQYLKEIKGSAVWKALMELHNAELICITCRGTTEEEQYMAEYFYLTILTSKPMLDNLLPKTEVGEEKPVVRRKRCVQ